MNGRKCYRCGVFDPTGAGAPGDLWYCSACSKAIVADHQGTVWLGDWGDPRYLGDDPAVCVLINNFAITPADVAPYEILLAYYGYIYYDGDAYVLLRHKESGELYEVVAGHCSCFGLEEQWEPEPTTADSIRYRVLEGALGVHLDEINYKAEILAVLDRLEPANE